MGDGRGFWIILGVIALGGAGAWWFLRAEPAPSPPVSAAAPAAPPPSVRLDAARPTGPLHPVPPPDEPATEPLSAETADGWVERALSGLLGAPAVRSVFQLDNFARRFVSTVDNLATPNAAPHLWPVRPTSGRLLTQEGAGTQTIDPANAQRYEPLVKLLTAADPKRVARIYLRLYPVLQQAYEDLGYPGRHFNDRVVDVIDHLLATPLPSGAVAVRRLQVEGAARPSNVFVFEDPRLERGTAGQKILWRVGSPNAERIKGALRAIRGYIVRGH